MKTTETIPNYFGSKQESSFSPVSLQIPLVEEKEKRGKEIEEMLVGQRWKLARFYCVTCWKLVQCCQE